MYDIEHLNRLRADAGLHHVDPSRAVLTIDPDGGFFIKYDRPVVDLGPMGEGVPVGVVHARSSEGAEVAMLDGLIRLHVAERRKIRLGVVCGWSGDQINRTPLTSAELSAYKQRLSHSKKVEQLRQELAGALTKRATDDASQRGIADLNERYGLATAHAPTEVPGPAVSAKPKRQRRQEVNNHE
ncbi:hypothetical protein [Pseudomonas putida]|uniref:hypothetical protein n=1 Tax=Pseudomonas putida TaxID=303 RepID=UPI0039DFF2F9